MKGKKTTAKTSKAKAVKRGKRKTAKTSRKKAVKTGKTKAVKRGKRTTAKTSRKKVVKRGKRKTAKTSRKKAVKTRKTKAVKRGKRVRKAKKEADATVFREPAVIVAAEPQSSGMVSERLVSKILDREADQRRMLWQMAEEMSRLGGAVQHQHNMLTDLVQHILHHADRQLPPGAPADEPSQAAPPNESAATEADADAARVSQEELWQLQDALVEEQEFVDRLHRPEAEDESAAAEADADAALVSQEELQNFQHALMEEQELVEHLRSPNAEGASAATEADADAALVPQDELLKLRDALVQEQELVERLRRSKLELERRAVAAEAELDRASPARRKSIWARLLGRDGET